ncbi:MAG: hypothetical protein Q4C70_10370, partial [Planctomycetia bacterium]|nr:hypothetical protein [Planctomycetia bacterium]
NFLKNTAFGACVSALPEWVWASVGVKKSMNNESAENICEKLPFVNVTPYSSDTEGKRWFKGNTHMHTFRSDGQAFPDEAAALYRRLVYHFVVLTDHNSTHEDKNRWVQVGTRRLTEKILARLENNFPDLMPEKRLNGDGIASYRLRSFDEMSALLNEPGRFLMISGNEVSVPSQNGDDLHCNLINTRSGCRVISRENTSENLDSTLKIRDELIGKFNPEAFLTVNHPLWKYFDVDPMDLVRHPSIRFFEVANVEARPLFPVPVEAWTHDKFWDIVNAFRAARGFPLLYAVASDDTHNYDMFYEKPLFVGYSMVLAEELSVRALMRAFYSGNFYASTGLTLECVRFDAETKTLSVAVEPEDEYKYTIQFIGTRRGFDEQVQRVIEHQAEGEIPPWLLQSGFRPKRELPIYSDEIGEVFQETRGVRASYQLKSEDLYVRAKIFTQKATQTENEHPSTPIAWTQPILNEWRKE